MIAKALPPSVKRLLYRFKPLARLIRGSLNLAVPTGIAEVEIAAGALKGYRFLLDLQTEKDYWLGTYETELQKAIKDWVKPGMVAYDLGANIGYISLMLADAVGAKGKVYSFEAFPKNYERLQANMELNEDGRRVKVIHGAVVASSDPVQFFIGPSGAMGKVAGAAGRADLHTESIEVPGYSMDDYVFDLGSLAPQVMKIDIEGGEVLALPGMHKILLDHRPVLFLELHGPEAARVAWEHLTAVNYRIAPMQSGYPTITSFDELDWKAYIVAEPK